MNMLELPVSDSLSAAIATTLLHSIWQGAVVLLLLRALLALTPLKLSGRRYSITAASMAAILVSALVTFAFVYEVTTPEETVSGYFSLTRSEAATSELTATPAALIASYKNHIVFLWIVGALLFMMRMLGGYAYLRYLRVKSKTVTGPLADKLSAIAEQLRIRKPIVLAESPRVFAPMVIGYLKPVILIPAGMATGLGTAEIEAVFIHELLHIRRNDFVFNLLQSLMEAIFFFNPFVWIMSSMLRTQREHCCDDGVLSCGANARAYVRALAALEESRLASTFAPSLAGNKNQLLQRIKRLMEKSAQRITLKEKVTPLVLVIIGLVCASWFSIQKGSDHQIKDDGATVAPADTTIRKRHKSATYSKKKTTVVAPDGKKTENIVEGFEGDEELRPAIAQWDFDFPVPPAADFSMPAMAPMPDMFFMSDSIPPFPHMRHDWKIFEEEFTRAFQQKFGDFYEKNEGEFERMMEEFEKKFEGKEEWFAQLEAEMHEHADAMEHRAHAFAEHAESLKAHEKEMEQMAEHMRDWEKEHGKHLKEMEKNLKAMEEKMQLFEKALKEELIRDGYLKSSDSIRNFSVDDSDAMEVNGQRIRGEHIDKYRELHRKYFGDAHGSSHYSE